MSSSFDLPFFFFFGVGRGGEWEEGRGSVKKFPHLSIGVIAVVYGITTVCLFAYQY